MMNPFSKPRPGDPLQIPAVIWSDLLDVVSWWRSRRSELNDGAGSVLDRRDTIEFESTDDFSLGQPVWLERPKETISPPSAGVLNHATRRFVARPIFKGTKISDWDYTVDGQTIHRQLGLVLGIRERAPGAKAGRVGVALMSGAGVAYMTTNGSGQFIQPTSGGCVYASTGFAQVMWPTANADRSSSPHLAYVRFTGCRTEVAQLNDSAHTWGVYWRDSCEGVWHKVVDLGLGDCANSCSGSSGSGGGGSGCSTEGYSPGAGWTSGGASGSYSASFFNDTATSPPAAPPSGSWVFSGTLPLNYQWYAPNCNWVAYGDFADF